MPLEQKQIMEYYNLRKNPAYLYLKGSRVLEFSNTCVHVADIFEGIGLTFNGLNAVPFVHLEAQTATAVENSLPVMPLHRKAALF